MLGIKLTLAQLGVKRSIQWRKIIGNGGIFAAERIFNVFSRDKLDLQRKKTLL